MNPTTIRALFTGSIALTAIIGGTVYALVAQSHGLSAEPPTWLAILIGGAVTFYYGQSAALNGSAAAITHFAAAVTARRATDETAIVNPPIPLESH